MKMKREKESEREKKKRCRNEFHNFHNFQQQIGRRKDIFFDVEWHFSLRRSKETYLNKKLFVVNVLENFYDCRYCSLVVAFSSFQPIFFILLAAIVLIVDGTNLYVHFNRS